MGKKFEVKNVAAIAGAVIAGLVAVVSNLSETKREQEFEEIKQRVAKLEENK